jgi:hypothetical protein
VKFIWRRPNIIDHTLFGRLFLELVANFLNICWIWLYKNFVVKINEMDWVCFSKTNTYNYNNFFFGQEFQVCFNISCISVFWKVYRTNVYLIGITDNPFALMRELFLSKIKNTYLFFKTENVSIVNIMLEQDFHSTYHQANLIFPWWLSKWFSFLSKISLYSLDDYPSDFLSWTSFLRFSSLTSVSIS